MEKWFFRVVLSLFLFLLTPSYALNSATSLTRQAPNLDPKLIHLALTAYYRAEAENYSHSPYLTIVDYALPSNQPRLWVIDVKTNRLLFNTYVAQGVKSGFKWARYFSNTPGSNASSLGLYKTDQAYYGQFGYALRLTGLDGAFNDNVYKRDIVIHSGWYVSAKLAKQYGYIGDSHGCFVVPTRVVQPLINTIKNGSLMFVYYPNKEWLTHSAFV